MADWRVWLGLGVSVVAVYWTLRGVNLGEVWRALRAAHPLPILAAMGLHIGVLWLRALRWRYLTLGLREGGLPPGALFRATSVGFMSMNILPLRLGELIRPWLLARETGVGASAALGTCVLERAIDFSCVAAVAAMLVWRRADALPGWVQSGAGLFGALALVPLLLAVALRVRRETTLAALARATRWLPGSLGGRVREGVNELCRGVAALRGGGSLLMVAVHSLLIWGLVIPATFALAMLAFDLPLPPSELGLASYTLLVFIALAIAAPSAPGFLGVYHFAAREALALSGISSATAVACGTAAHISFWLPITAVGVVCAFLSGARPADLAQAGVGKAASDRLR
ncbi:MAG: lysylphosphatidylglycerol synthase transmembrane domain-containing protein [Myxococcota bacterium]